MSQDLSHHPLFVPWTEPRSGVVSFVLTPLGHPRRLAPTQQQFYFCTPSVSPDEKWLWITCAFPPNPTKTLAVVSLDAANPVIRHFPAAAEVTAQSMVAPDSRGCYFGNRETIYHVSLEGAITPVFSLPPEFVAGRTVPRLATHLTLSADKRHLLLDGQIGDHYFVATADLSKPHGDPSSFRLIKEFPHNHNHAQFHPSDPKLFVVAHDHTRFGGSGFYAHHNLRCVLLDTDDSRYDLLTAHRYNKHLVGPSHEWWSADGFLCYVDYQFGAFEISPEKLREPARYPAADLATNVWPGELCHAHCSRDRRFWVADESPYKWAEKPCQVLFRDRRSGKVTCLANAMPQPNVNRSWYHIDPHPQFSPQDGYIIYTTTVYEGNVDVALVPTHALA